MDRMRKRQTDIFCQYPAIEGVSARCVDVYAYTHITRLRAFLAREMSLGCNCIKLEIKRRKSKICNIFGDLFAYVKKI